MKRLFLTIVCSICIFIILISPQIITEGVRQGIKLNLYSIIPSLLPFMVLTNIMLKYNLCQYISYLFNPLLSKVFRVSSMGCFAIIIGFTCGYPMGAKIIGDLYGNKFISKSEANYLITFCNNCSITFLLNYILFNCIGSNMPLYIVVILVYLPPIITGIINKYFLKPDITELQCIRCNSTLSDKKMINPILNAIKSMSILSVYIICFTIVSNLITSISYFSKILKCVIVGLTEITSGSNYIATSMTNIHIRNFLILAFTVFGGLSIAFQSFEHLQDISFKKYYLIGKLEQLLIFCIIYFFII